MVPAHAVEGGVDDDGTPLLLGQAYHDGCGWQPAQVNLERQKCAIGNEGKVYNCTSSRILIWA